MLTTIQALSGQNPHTEFPLIVKAAYLIKNSNFTPPPFLSNAQYGGFQTIKGILYLMKSMCR